MHRLPFGSFLGSPGTPGCRKRQKALHSLSRCRETLAGRPGLRSWHAGRRLAAVGLTAVLTLAPLFGAAQQLQQRLSTLGGGRRLVRPVAMALSPSGQQVAIVDQALAVIIVIDLDGDVIWTVGKQVHLDQPQAVWFAAEDRLCFVQQNQPYILAVSQKNVAVLDTLVDLSDALTDEYSVDQVVRHGDYGYLVLDKTSAQIHLLDQAWNLSPAFMKNGSGKGRLLVPTAVASITGNRVVVTDRKNYPVQVFTAEGKFLFQAGWNQPATERSWEATAITVDNREIIWVADETNRQFRFYDPSGVPTGTSAFEDQSLLPVAMTATSDGRILVLDARGDLLFYVIE